MPLPEEMDGAQRRQLREAILARFGTFEDVRSALDDNNVSVTWSLVDDGPNLQARVNSLLRVCYKHGLIEQACDALASTEPVNQPVQAEILMVKAAFRKWREARLKLRLVVVVSSFGTDEQYKRSFLRPDTLAEGSQGAGGFSDALEPCDIIDTCVRLKESPANAASILRDIGQAHLFAAILSSRYIQRPETVAEFEHGLESLRRKVEAGDPRPRLFAVVRDKASSDWLERKIAEAGELPANSVVIENLFDGDTRRKIGGPDGAGKQIAAVARQLRDYFDSPVVDEVQPPEPPSPLRPPPAATSRTIVLLGEPRKAKAGVSEAAAAAGQLIDELNVNGLSCEAWGDGWREAKRSVAFLEKQPLFVRAVVDRNQVRASDLLDRLASELNVTFGFEFDEAEEKVRAIAERPKVLWRPNGPEWDGPETGPLRFARSDRPADFVPWLAGQLGIDLGCNGNAIVCYEDPVDRGDLENPVRRAAVEQCLREAIALEQPPLTADSQPFGFQQLQEIIDSIRDDRLTVIAAHDMRSIPGSGEDTLKRFRDIDRRIDESLAKNHNESAPLMRVAVLLRNWRLFPYLEFSRNSRISKWQLLRIRREGAGFVADSDNVDRLREHAAQLLRRTEIAAP